MVNLGGNVLNTCLNTIVILLHLQSATVHEAFHSIVYSQSPSLFSPTQSDHCFIPLKGTFTSRCRMLEQGFSPLLFLFYSFLSCFCPTSVSLILCPLLYVSSSPILSFTLPLSLSLFLSLLLCHSLAICV